MLEKIIERYYDEIFRYCWHHVDNKETAEDLCQDTFIRFIEHYENFRHIGKTKNYLYTIARNKCKDYYKKQVPSLLETIPEQADERNLEENVIMRQMIMGLSEELKEVITLRYLQNLKYADIAVILRISQSLAKYRVKKALEQLAIMEGGQNDIKRS